MIVKCEDCGRMVERKDAFYVEHYLDFEGIDGFVCKDCFDKRWFVCDECKGFFRKSLSVDTPDGRGRLCLSCANRYGIICPHCGQFFYYNKKDNKFTYENIKSFEDEEILSEL